MLSLFCRIDFSNFISCVSRKLHHGPYRSHCAARIAVPRDLPVYGALTSQLCRFGHAQLTQQNMAMEIPLFIDVADGDVDPHDSQISHGGRNSHITYGRSKYLRLKVVQKKSHIMLACQSYSLNCQPSKYIQMISMISNL